MTTQANTYTVLAGPPSFVQPGFNVSSFYRRNSRESLSDTYRFQSTGPYELLDVAYDLHTRMHSMSAFEIMDTTQCFRKYSQQYISSWGDLFVELSPVKLYLNHTSCADDPGCLDFVCGINCTDYISTMEWDDSAMAWKSGPGSTDGHANKDGHTNQDDWLDPNYENPTFLAFSVPSSYPSYQWIDSNNGLFDPGETQDFHLSLVKCWAEKVSESCTLYAESQSQLCASRDSLQSHQTHHNVSNSMALSKTNSHHYRRRNQLLFNPAR